MVGGMKKLCGREVLFGCNMCCGVSICDVFVICRMVCRLCKF